jgi:hypothetical protein
VVGPRKLLWPSCGGLIGLILVMAFTATAPARREAIAVSVPTALHGIDCISSSDCWAVGVVNKAGVPLNQAEHFNGKRWKRVSTPDPSSTGSGDTQQLFAVSCVSRSDCWAVGSYLDASSQARLDQALHWNGRKWKLVSTPQPSTDDNDGLSGISCVSGSDCWAVGTTGSMGGPGLGRRHDREHGRAGAQPGSALER